MKIGVFDSGVGGLSVARALEKALPEHSIIFRNDVKHLPYGTKPASELLGYVEPILQSLIEDGCAVIVIACNTITTTLIEKLRHQFRVPLVGIEPMVKPASAMTKSGIIAVCATPTTLKSVRYSWLKEVYASEIKVLEPDCSSWTRMIEDKNFDHARVADAINDVVTLGADVIVLGCTHYHWIEKEIRSIAGSRAVIIQPEEAIIKQVRKVLADISRTS